MPSKVKKRTFCWKKIGDGISIAYYIAYATELKNGMAMGEMKQSQIEEEQDIFVKPEKQHGSRKTFAG